MNSQTDFCTVDADEFNPILNPEQHPSSSEQKTAEYHGREVTERSMYRSISAACTEKIESLFRELTKQSTKTPITLSDVYAQKIADSQKKFPEHLKIQVYITPSKYPRYSIIHEPLNNPYQLNIFRVPYEDPFYFSVVQNGNSLKFEHTFKKEGEYLINVEKSISSSTGELVLQLMKLTPGSHNVNTKKKLKLMHSESKK